MSEYHDDTITAGDPVDIGLSLTKLRALDPDVFADDRVPHARIHEHLGFGDSRAAVVASVQPLLVAAYTDEIDCVVLLRFPDFLTAAYGLEVGSRLLTVNTYDRGRGHSPDITPGPYDLGRWASYYPLIADFLTDDLDVVATRKAAITEDEWQHTVRLGQAYLDAKGKELVRDGHPYLSFAPAGGEPGVRSRIALYGPLVVGAVLGASAAGYLGYGHDLGPRPLKVVVSLGGLGGAFLVLVLQRLLDELRG